MKPIVLYALKPVLYNILVLTTLFEKRAGSKKKFKENRPDQVPQGSRISRLFSSCRRLDLMTPASSGKREFFTSSAQALTASEIAEASLAKFLESLAIV